MDPVAGLTAIFFVCTLVLFAISTLIYSIFVAHYMLTTLSDASSGQDEAQFPSESIFDWWWKPILFGWVLLMWLIPVTLLLTPIVFASPETFWIIWTLVLWILYPLSLASALYTQNWLQVIHFGLIGRMFHHFPAMIYTYVITFIVFAGTLWIVGRALMDSLLWMIPAVVCVPAMFLLYARHWGRFAWLSLNHLPRYARTPRRDAPKRDAPHAEDEAPPAENKPAPAVTTPAAPILNDEGEDIGPYPVIQDPNEPTFEETPEEPPLAILAPPRPPPPVVEEEDEWATDKKPYTYVEPDLPPEPEAVPGVATKTKTDPNKPITATQYYDDRAKRERKAKRKAEEEKKAMPALSKKTPSFQTALLSGVWGFFGYNSTLQVLGNLVVMTMIELFILYMLVLFLPRG